jgi:EAL domain-containing protein (putative c-di-GMP-specific phosphodiesterase class I)
MINNNALMCGVHDRAAAQSIPFAVVSSGANVGFFLRGLERGLAHVITAPFNSEFLVSRVREILDYKAAGEDKGTVSLDFSHRGSDYALNIPPSQLSQFIMSLLHDSANHAAALSELLQKRNALHQRICRPDLFDGVRSKSEEELAFEQDMYRALDAGEFAVYYQPIVSIADNRVRGFEALVRWHHPSRGLVQPADFIPAAERNPLIIPLGFWIIEEAIRRFASWQRSCEAARSLYVGINLSANQFVHPELSASINGLMKKHGVAPDNVAFEITETAFMTDMESANLQLLRLKAGRHRIIMDDFGTGYSSLSYLQHFPVDTLKIDRSFVRWMHMDEQSEHIVRSIVGLAHNLGIRVVAEGVEEEEHRRKLGELQCDYGQGYLFSPPLDPAAAGEFVRNL